MPPHPSRATARAVRSRALVRWTLGALAAVAALCAVLAPTAPAAAKPDRAPRPSIVNHDGSESIPWQAAIVPLDPNGRLDIPLAVFCGATIRDARHVITAAHCVDDKSASELAVFVGLYERSAPEQATDLALVTAITSHPGFDAGMRNDLAILTLDRDLNLSTPDAWPLPVVQQGADVTGREAVVSGWGLTESGGQDQPDQLLYAIVRAYADQACGAYGAGFDPSVMLCAGWELPNGSASDSCQGDSGGPLRLNESPFVLIGVVSWGNGCGDPRFPGIYTKLSNADLNARATDPNPPVRLAPTAAPRLGGTARAGGALTCTGAGWTLPPTSEAATWLSGRVVGDRLEDVRVDGTGATLALDDGDVGRVFTCIVRGTNAGGWRDVQAEGVVGPVEARPAGGGNPPGGNPPGGNPPGGTPPGGTPPGGNPPVADIVPPRADITRRACAKRRCALTISATDLAGPVSSATVAYQRLSGCPKGKRGKRCRAVRRLSARRAADGVFTIRTPKLAVARYRFTVTAVDAAGNRSTGTSVVLKVAKR